MSCYHSKIINAPADKVWAAIRDFHELSWAKGVIETCEKIGDKAGDQIGAKRRLNDAFIETLVCLDDENRSFSYSIDAGPGPFENDGVTGYVGTVRVFSLTDGDRTFVEWSSKWADSSGGVREFCDPIYQGALSAMAATLGA